MTVLKADKIFVEPTEELTFLIERILASSFDYAILVFPSNSSIFSSTLSLKVLFHRLTDEKKICIIVTEDEYGQVLAQKAGFVVVQKVSQITSELWEVAQSKFQNFIQKQNQRKNTLLEERHPKEFIQTDKAANASHVQSGDDNVDMNDLQNKQAQHNTSASDLSEDIVGSDVEDNDDVSASNIPQKIKPKVKIISGLKVFQSGDIELLQSKKKNGRIGELNNSKQDSMNERKVDTSVFSESRFAGRDLTRMTGNKSRFSKLLDSIIPKRKVHPEDRLNPDSAYKKPFYTTPLFIAFASFFSIFILIFLLTIFQFSRVAVTITLKSEAVLATQSIALDLDDDAEIDYTRLRLPAQKIYVTETISGSAEANGEGKRGERARGSIYIFNTSTEEIILPAGTKLTSVANNLDYEIVEDTVLPPATETSDGTTKASRVDGIIVQAVSYGTQYNIPSSASTAFRISIENSDAIDVNRETAFEGGTEESFVSVSQDNVNALKEQLIDQLEGEIRSSLEAAVPSGFILIEQSIKITEKEIRSIPEVGEPAKQDGESFIFDLSIELEGTALMIRESELNEIIEFSLLESEQSENIVNNLNDIRIDAYRDTGTTPFIEVSAQGNVTKNITEADVEELIKGKSIADAKEILSSIENLQSYTIKYAPSFIPLSIQRVPTSNSRITVSFK
ncbi:MAG: hypothetical protein Kow0081_0840 [Candidatus Dojkabacteria bacterium]